VIDEDGRTSLPFPWAEVGAEALHGYAARAGLTLVRQRWSGSRTFAVYARPAA
jgi:hypothetical protein